MAAYEEQEEKMMKYGNKSELTWDMRQNMTPVVIITVHSRPILSEKSLRKLLLRKSTSNFILSVLRSVKMRFKYSQKGTLYQTMC